MSLRLGLRIGAVVTDILATLAGWCGVVPLGGGVSTGLFLAGLAGGPLHCGPMCGGFVLGQAADRMARLPAAGLCEMSRLKSSALLPYHLGRLSTYTALGGLAGLGGAAATPTPWLSALLLLIAAMLFLGLGLRWISPGLPGWLRGLPAMLGRYHTDNGYVLGVALGFLPCGLLYGALAVAAASGGVWSGAAGMLAFGLGTVPTLVAVGLAGRVAGMRFRRAVAVASPIVMVLNASLLAILAARLWAAGA